MHIIRSRREGFFTASDRLLLICTLLYTYDKRRRFSWVSVVRDGTFTTGGSSRLTPMFCLIFRFTIYFFFWFVWILFCFCCSSFVLFICLCFVILVLSGSFLSSVVLFCSGCSFIVLFCPVLVCSVAFWSVLLCLLFWSVLFQFLFLFQPPLPNIPSHCP